MESIVLLLAVFLPTSAALLFTGFWVLRKKREVVYQALGAAAIVFGALLLLALIVSMPLIATTSTPVAIEKQEQPEPTPIPAPQVAASQIPSAPPAPTAKAIHEQQQPLTPLSTATPSLPIPPIPQAYIEYNGGLYPGRLSSYCWPVSANSTVCTAGAAWQGFDEAPALRMNRGDAFKIVITDADYSPDPELTQFAALTVVETEPLLRLGEQVYSIDVEGKAHVPDLPEGIYFAAVFLKYRVGDVSHGFKIEIVH